MAIAIEKPQIRNKKNEREKSRLNEKCIKKQNGPYNFRKLNAFGECAMCIVH